MNFRKSLWSLSRRELFKLLPPGLASWALPAPLLRTGPGAPEPEPAVPGSEAKIWQAHWIWEPVMVKPRGDSPGVQFFETKPFKNLFTLFRKTFDQQRPAARALAQISADSRYILYVNGDFVGRGPARFDPTWPYYDEFDLVSVLRPGKNVIAVLLHYYGEKTGSYLDQGRPGLLFECRLDGVGGETTLVKTDATWKFVRAPMWDPAAPRISSALGFTEIYDAAKEIEGWTRPEYNDEHWRQVQVISRTSGDSVPLLNPYPWDNLVRRDIPMLMEKEVLPSHITFVGEVRNLPAGTAPSLAHQMSLETPGPLKNCSVQNAQSLTAESGGAAVIRTTSLSDGDGSSAVLVLDFGREVTGRQRLELDGVAGGIVDMGVCESLANGRVTPTRNGLHFNRLLMRDGPQRWEAFEWDGFRYLQLTIRNCARPITLRKAGVSFTSYPAGNRGSFQSSDLMLNKIWETCRYTVQLCMQDAYIDCPNREQRQWVGDAYVETKVNYSIFGDTKLAAKYLRQIGQSQRSDGIVMMFWPGDDRDSLVQVFNIKDFVLHWVSTAWEYYQFTGDEAMVREVFPKIEKALGWFQGRVDAQGRLSNITPWVFGDWAPLDRRNHNAILNALFYNALRQSAQMAALANRGAAQPRCRKLAERVKAGINEHLWDERRRVYVDSDADGVASGRVSQQSNALCLLYDIAPAEKRAGILNYIFDPQRVKMPEMDQSAGAGFDNRRDVVQAQPYFMHWVNAALAHVGEYELMTKLMRQLWGPMIQGGATTVWETWSPNASECHAWSATPAYDLMTYILGVRGVTAGFGEIAIEPHPAGLDWARGVFPSVKGDIPVSWRSTSEEFRVEAALPASTVASVLIPFPRGRKISLVQVNGGAVWRVGEALRGAGVRQEKNGIRLELRRQGYYEIVARY